jgi:hypothetical protein
LKQLAWAASCHHSTSDEPERKTSFFTNKPLPIRASPSWHIREYPDPDMAVDCSEFFGVFPEERSPPIPGEGDPFASQGLATATANVSPILLKCDTRPDPLLLIH